MIANLVSIQCPACGSSSLTGEAHFSPSFEGRNFNPDTKQMETVTFPSHSTIYNMRQTCTCALSQVEMDDAFSDLEGAAHFHFAVAA